MSLEVFGGGDEFDTDILTRRGWQHSDDGERWWREGEPETTCTLAEAIQAHEDWMMSDE